MKRIATILALLTVMVPSLAQARNTWTALMVKAGNNNAIIFLDAVDSQHAWFFGVDSSTGNGQFMGWRTTDGQHLTAIGLPSPSAQQSMVIPTSMAFSDKDNGYMGVTEVEMTFPPKSHNRLYKSTNGGLSWQVVQDELEEPVKLMRSMPTGEIFGLNDKNFLIIRDDTITSVPLPGLSGDVVPNEIGMVNLQCGFVVGGRGWPEQGDTPPPGDGIVWHTSDGGNTWEVVSSGLPFNVHAVSFVSSLTGWIGGTDGDRAYLYHTVDGGQSWEELSLPNHPPTGVMGDTEEHPLTDVVYIRFFDHNRGVVVAHACISNCKPSEQGGDDPLGGSEEGQEPTVLTAVLWTEDGGRSWEFDSDVEEAMKTGDFMPEMMVFSPMFAIKFVSPNHGFMGGKNLLVLAYDAANPVEEPEGYPSCDESPDNPADDTDNGGSTTGDASEADDGSSSSSGGCGCSVPGRHTELPLPFLLLLAMVAAGLRRTAR